MRGLECNWDAWLIRPELAGEVPHPFPPCRWFHDGTRSVLIVRVEDTFKGMKTAPAKLEPAWENPSGESAQTVCAELSPSHPMRATGSALGSTWGGGPGTHYY
eukprot:3709197-Rhodomonas_salina.4